jgi:hypothetical protein
MVGAWHKRQDLKTENQTVFQEMSENDHYKKGLSKYIQLTSWEEIRYEICQEMGLKCSLPPKMVIH